MIYFVSQVAPLDSFPKSNLDLFYIQIRTSHVLILEKQILKLVRHFFTFEKSFSTGYKNLRNWQSARTVLSDQHSNTSLLVIEEFF